MDERRILFEVDNGYDIYSFNERSDEYSRLFTGLKYGGLTEDEVRKRVEELKAQPLPICGPGYEIEKVDFILGDQEKKLLMYNAADFAKIELVRCGYTMESVEAKVFAYNDLIHEINDSMNTVIAMNELERVRQLPLKKAKFFLLMPNSYDREQTDAFLAELDSHVSNMI
ncbi:hypothetical protein SAMN02910265_01520 [Ruminococcus flavefaciens]|uniref:Uncharacterized protein n=1 Tax=Ruminococcus flavefaciens TaxID=1265 RepID=A0A1H6J5B3_RUMFL|nr:hypothetical protein [Ruminococcus flavefaciens]SEH56855.1 hypothetical protein SAMN02910265_01520 [Ruminococcus flavefaciens]